MKRILQILIRLYPKAWRERYQSEFTALLDDVNPNGPALFDVFKGGIAMQIRMLSGLKIIAVTALLGLAVGLGTAIKMKDQYASTALFELRDEPFAGQVEALVKPALSNRALTEIIDRYRLYPTLHGKEPLENIVAGMKDDILIHPAGKNRMALQFIYYDRPLSQRVCAALVDALMRHPGDLIHPERVPLTIRLLDAPSLADGPIYPNRFNLVVTGLLAGTIIGLPIAFFRRRSPKTSLKHSTFALHPYSGMDYRQLGHSGLKVSSLSFGAGTFGGGTQFFKAWGATDAQGAKRIVDVCLDAGINLFDTADIYSNGLSEQILGEAVQGKRDQLLISSKCTFRFGDGPNDVGSSRYHLIHSCEQSLKRLKTDRIDIYHMHAFDATTPVDETVEALDGLVKAGKVRYVACSNFSGWHLMKSIAVAKRYGWTRYVAHQVYYSLVGRDYEWELMPLGVDQKVGALIWSPLGWGRLTGKIRRGQPAAGR